MKDYQDLKNQWERVATQSGELLSQSQNMYKKHQGAYKNL